jgi:branched-chain amino acid transport system substrate-binding protein
LSPAGFAGVDGVFRFRSDGTNVRALSVLELRNGATGIVSAAPKSFGPSGT